MEKKNVVVSNRKVYVLNKHGNKILLYTGDIKETRTKLDYKKGDKIVYSPNRISEIELEGEKLDVIEHTSIVRKL